MRKNLLSLMLAAFLCLGVLSVSALAFNPDAYKPEITKVSIGKPIKSVETGKKYIPVTVHFTSEENPGEGHAMLEGIVKALHAKGENDVAGVGMTLMRVSSSPGNNQFTWDPATGKGTLKYNVPVLGDGDTQSVEHSAATGQDEVNGLKSGDTLKMRLESWVEGYDDNPIKSNEAVVVYKPGELPRDYTVGSETKTYTLTVNFTGPKGFPAPASVVESGKKEGEAYSVPVPEVKGYQRPFKKVKGTMPAADKTETVTYKKLYTLRITYVFPKETRRYGKEVEMEWELADGEEYRKVSNVVASQWGGGGPYAFIEIGGWVPDKEVVEGTIHGADVEETVTYSCIHPERSSYYEKKDDATHRFYCSACKTVLVESEPHVQGAFDEFVPYEAVPAKYRADYPNGYCWYRCTKCLGLYRVPAEKHAVREGDGQTVESAADGAKFRVKAAYDKFTGVVKDGDAALKRGTDFTDRDGSTVIELTKSYLKKLKPGAHTLTAVFQDGFAALNFTTAYDPSAPKTCKVTFDAGGGSGKMKAVKVRRGEMYTLPECGFTAPKGKVFKAWDKGAVGAQIKIKADTVITARWKKQPAPVICTITFKPNGGKGTMKAQKAEKGATVTLNANKFKRAKHVFGGWNTMKDGSGKAYKAGAKIKLKNDLTLYAQWKKISLKQSKISAIKKGEKVKLTATLTIGGKAVRDKKVTFVFNGKKYTAKTNKKGVAEATIPVKVTKALKVGKKYTITATYADVTVKQTVKVKK